MDYYRSEIKTGIMVIICLAILIFMTFYIGGSTFLGNTFNVNAAYQNVGGLELDAPVYFSGLEVGKVKSISLLTKEQRDNFPDCFISVNIDLDSKAQVKADSKIIIKTMGFMGLKYIDITPGSDNAENLLAGTLVKGEASQDINDVMDSVGDIVSDIKPKTKSIVSGLDSIVGKDGSLPKLINDTDEIITVNRDDFNKIVANLALATEYFKDFANDIKQHPWKLLIKTSDNKETKKSTQATKSELKQPQKQSFTGRREYKK